MLNRAKRSLIKIPKSILPKDEKVGKREGEKRTKEKGIHHRGTESTEGRERKPESRKRTKEKEIHHREHREHRGKREKAGRPEDEKVGK